jgi:hypothetical protein
MSERTLVNRCTDGNLCCPIPDAVQPSIDLARFWTTRQPTAHDLAPFNRRRIRVRRPSAYPIWTIAFAQPADDALAIIRDRRQHWWLTGAEFALDWIYADAEMRARATVLHHRHFLHPRHRDHVRFSHDTTRYTRDRFTGSGRLTRLNFADYADQRSKVDRQPCLHIECRINSADALRRAAGVYGVADLIGFDHRWFWQRH